MHAEIANAGTPKLRAATPIWLWAFGAFALIGSAALAARLIWEETVWTWERGPQMVGFSLAHGFGAILLLFPWLLLLWTVVALILTIWNLIRKKVVSWTRWVALGVAFSLFVVLSLPESFWERLCIGRMSASPHASELFTYAAAEGNLGAVKAFLSHGLSVNAVNERDGTTAVHAAAQAGSASVLRYLISKGADINALDREGDSPLELAVSSGHSEAAGILQGHGAKRVRGSDEQRQKAINDEVEEDIQRLNRAEGRHR